MHVTSFHRHLLPYFIINHNLQIGLILDYLMIYNIYLSLENNLFILYQREHLNSGPHQWCLSLNHGLFKIKRYSLKSVLIEHGLTTRLVARIEQ